MVVNIAGKLHNYLDMSLYWVKIDSLELLTNPYSPAIQIMNKSTHELIHPSEHRTEASADCGTSTPCIPPSGKGSKKRAGDRLNIPSSIVLASGFAPGDKAFVVDEDPTGAVLKPCLVLLKEQPPKLLADYVVAKDRRIRVTPAMLKKCGLEGESFEIVGGNGKIIVRLAKVGLTP